MAHFLHITFLDEAKPRQTFRVKPDYFACIVTKNDQPHLAVTRDNGGTEYIPANSVASTWLETKRDTPARDAKVAALDDAKAAYQRTLDRLQREFDLPDEKLTAFEELLFLLFDNRADVLKANAALVTHDFAMAKARKPKTTDAPPAPKKSRKKKSA